jgi:hypothetical protein
MGSIDWLTTIIGIVYFGAVEGNPFLAGITSTSLPAFTAIKLSTTLVIGLLFYNAEKMLLKSDKNTKAFRCARLVLRVGYIVAMALLLAAVVNNLLVVVKAI